MHGPYNNAVVGGRIREMAVPPGAPYQNAPRGTPREAPPRPCGGPRALPPPARSNGRPPRFRKTGYIESARPLKEALGSYASTPTVLLA